MKLTRQLFSALLCLVLVFTSSSLVVNAAENDPNYHAFVEYFYKTSGYNAAGSVITYPKNGITENITLDRPVSSSYNINGFQYRVTLANDDNTRIIEKNSGCDLIIDNIPLAVDFWGHQVPYAGIENIELTTILLFYDDGTMEYLHNLNTNYEVAHLMAKNGRVTIKAEDVSINRDVLKIEFIIRGDYVSKDSQGDIEGILGELNDNDFTYELTVYDPNTGLLQGIADYLSGILDNLWQWFDSLFEWLNNIWETISNGFESVAQWFNQIIWFLEDKLFSLWQEIYYLPDKLSDMFIGLFVPDPEELIVALEEYLEVYEDKFGFLGEIAELIGSFIADCLHSDRIDSITIPEVSIDLPENESFSFGGQSVKVVPDGLADLVNVCKGIVGIMCTFLFINGMRKRYDELMGVEK